MNTIITMQTHANNYLAERRGLGFSLRSPGYSINSFAHYVDTFNCKRPLTVAVMADWSKQDKSKSNNPITWAARLKKLRPFAHYLQQFEPETEVPDKSVFGSTSYRLAPHIYTENEILDLLAAARALKPQGGLRSVTYETLFGLMASTGLRISEAVHLLNNDVDLKRGILTIRQTKFAKSRYVPMHSTTTHALRKYCLLRNSYITPMDKTSFFVGSCGQHLGQPISLGTVRQTFANLRRQLNWINRGAHDAPRTHDLRHTFIVRRMMLWHTKNINIDQKMLSLATYVGHSMVTNTYWYLSCVPELMALAGNKFELYTQVQESDYD
ncbi:MAG: tyrosine-type recombinase/integrase [Gammaproteobacteria bacterium]|nr:tyrosine-type recombinase/integrase [Gammaproteobacteria bacterium]